MRDHARKGVEFHSYSGWLLADGANGAVFEGFQHVISRL